jgi:hypothetical protein
MPNEHFDLERFYRALETLEQLKQTMGEVRGALRELSNKKAERDEMKTLREDIREIERDIMTRFEERFDEVRVLIQDSGEQNAVNIYRDIGELKRRVTALEHKASARASMIFLASVIAFGAGIVTKSWQTVVAVLKAWFNAPNR